MSLTAFRQAICDQCGEKATAEQLSDLQRQNWLTVIVLPIGASLEYDKGRQLDLCPGCAQLTAGQLPGEVRRA